MSLRRLLVLLAILFFVIAAISLARAARDNARKKTLQPLGAATELRIDRSTG